MEVDKELLNAITIDDLSEEQRQIAELIGFDNYKKLVRIFAGMSIYIPKMDSLEASVRNRKIRAEFNGFNYQELVRKYHISERHIRRIIDNRDDNQISLF